MSEKFQGFDKPKANFSRLPHQLISELHRFSSLAELKVVLYTLRHTWGYDDDYKKITHDEFENGRKDKDGNRLDSGVGMTKPSIIDGIKRAIADGFLYVYTDTSDTARVKKFYSLTEQGLKSFTPEVKKLYPRGKESLHRTEKETIERNIEKDKEIATDVALASTDNSQLNENKKPRTPKQLANDALVEALGLAYGVEAKGKDFGLYLKTAQTLIEAGITSDNFAGYVSFVRKLAGEDWKVSIPSLVAKGRPSEYAAKRKTKPSALNGNGAPKAIEGRYVDKASVTPVTDDYRRQYGLPDVTESDVPSFLLDETKG